MKIELPNITSSTGSRLAQIVLYRNIQEAFNLNPKLLAAAIEEDARDLDKEDLASHARELREDVIQLFLNRFENVVRTMNHGRPIDKQTSVEIDFNLDPKKIIEAFRILASDANVSPSAIGAYFISVIRPVIESSFEEAIAILEGTTAVHT